MSWRPNSRQTACCCLLSKLTVLISSVVLKVSQKCMVQCVSTHTSTNQLQNSLVNRNVGSISLPGKPKKKSWRSWARGWWHPCNTIIGYFLGMAAVTRCITMLQNWTCIVAFFLLLIHPLLTKLFSFEWGCYMSESSFCVSLWSSYS